MKIIAVLVAGVLLLAATAADPSIQAMVPATGLEADAAVLHDVYAQLHPGLYRYLTPAQFEQRYADLRSSLNHDQTRADAFLAFTRFTAAIKCGHSYPNFYNQSDDVAKELFQHQDRVPFYFEWIGTRMIVTKNYSSDSRLVPGSEIVRINNTPVADILAALMPLARADGSNDAKRVNQLGVRGDDRYEAFDVYFPLVFKQTSTTMALDVRSPNDTRFQSKVSALTYEQRIAPIGKALAATKGDSPLWTFTMLDSRTGYLKMPTWETYNSKWDWKADIERSFASLSRNGATRLIIDLRGNEGGTDVGKSILAHLITSPLHLDSYRRLVRYRSVPEALRPNLHTWDKSFFDLGESARTFDERFFELTDSGDSAAIEPQAPRFAGSVVVLVDAANSSATFQFDDLVQKNKIGTLVGTPTGGNQRGINGGAFFFVRLPKSNIEVDLPLIGTFPVANRPDGGLMPDHDVEDTVESIAHGEDPQLTAARTLPE